MIIDELRAMLVYARAEQGTYYAQAEYWYAKAANAEQADSAVGFVLSEGGSADDTPDFHQELLGKATEAERSHERWNRRAEALAREIERRIAEVADPLVEERRLDVSATADSLLVAEQAASDHAYDSAREAAAKQPPNRD